VFGLNGIEGIEYRFYLMFMDINECSIYSSWIVMVYHHKWGFVREKIGI
jgi:hypothetical protein